MGDYRHFLRVSFFKIVIFFKIWVFSKICKISAGSHCSWPRLHQSTLASICKLGASSGFLVIVLPRMLRFPFYVFLTGLLDTSTGCSSSSYRDALRLFHWRFSGTEESPHRLANRWWNGPCGYCKSFRQQWAILLYGGFYLVFRRTTRIDILEFFLDWAKWLLAVFSIIIIAWWIHLTST